MARASAKRRGAARHARQRVVCCGAPRLIHVVAMLPLASARAVTSLRCCRLPYRYAAVILITFRHSSLRIAAADFASDMSLPYCCRLCRCYRPLLFTIFSLPPFHAAQRDALMLRRFFSPLRRYAIDFHFSAIMIR